MTGAEPWISGVGSDRWTNSAKTTALDSLCFCFIFDKTTSGNAIARIFQLANRFLSKLTEISTFGWIEGRPHNPGIGSSGSKHTQKRVLCVEVDVDDDDDDDHRWTKIRQKCKFLVLNSGFYCKSFENLLLGTLCFGTRKTKRSNKSCPIVQNYIFALWMLFPKRWIITT